MDNVEIRKRRGCLHFIRFQTTDMGNFLSLAKQKGMAELVTTACATGGGAFKFENDFREVINLHFNWILFKCTTSSMKIYSK